MTPGTDSYQTKDFEDCIQEKNESRLLDTNLYRATYGVAVAAMAGWPSNTITRSARYVAMMKSCSMMNAVFLACNTNLRHY